jgi:hypothetical protein
MSLTPEEFDDLLPVFERAYLKKYPTSKTLTGKALKRKVGVGRKGTLRTIEQKSLFTWSIRKDIPYKGSRVNCIEFLPFLRIIRFG